ncbi:MAG: YggS family pyridoxal phosphate-dependent enzyme [bacterium]
MGDIREHIAAVKERIAEAALRSGRNPDGITLVAVTKTIETHRIREGIAAGLTVFGENRVQEAEGKIGEIGHGVRWHMIGHLQTNKVKRAVELFDLIQSVDSLHLAGEIEKRASAVGRRIPVLLQVDLAGEETKFGFTPEELLRDLQGIAGCSHIEVSGLMTIPPFSPDPERSRPYFTRLAHLAERIKEQCPGDVSMDILSMGMSQDYEVAVEEGATMIRIGTALFGARH